MYKPLVWSMAIRVVEISNGGVQNYEDFCLRINILIGNYLILRIGLVGASEVFKNQSSKSPLFSSSQQKNTSNWNHGLILMLILFFNLIFKNLQFSFSYAHNFRTLWKKLDLGSAHLSSSNQKFLIILIKCLVSLFDNILRIEFYEIHFNFQKAIIKCQNITKC